MSAAFETLAQRSSAVELDVYPRLPVVFVKGEGCYLIDDAGRRYLDLYAGHAVSSTGHCHPHVVEAIKSQADQLLFFSNAAHHPERVAAAEMLSKRAPTAGARIFFCSSGAEANEAALKLARKVTGRRKVVSFVHSFHGRTLGALSAAGIDKYRDTAQPTLVDHHVYVPFGDVSALNAAVDNDTAAILCEAIQSLGGVRTAPDSFFFLMHECARKHGAALILDEIQTFARTGAWFYSNKVCVEPDMLTIAKGVGSGVPVAALLTAPQWAQHVKPGDHGTTFGGGPLAMAAVRATLEVIEREHLVSNAHHVGAHLNTHLRDTPGVVEVRGAGLLIGIQLDRPAKDVQRALLERGFLVGSSSDPNVMRLLPPLILTTEQADTFLTALRAVLA